MRLFFITFCCFISLAGAAQSSYQFGILPAINLNKSFANNWKINLKTESRQILKEGLFSEKNMFQYKYTLTDIAVVASKKTGLNTALAGGYMLRIRDEQFIHRTIQQFTMVSNYSGFRLAHRFSSDQTFEENEAVAVRLRYRITSEFPLSGQSVDPKELYLKINHEYVNAVQDTNYDLEIRLIPLLGYTFSDTNKLESGLDYRLNSFLGGNPRSRFWITLNWFISL